MTNGGGEGGSQRRELQGKRNLFRGNDFAGAVARMAVAQICESVELSSYQGSQTREGVRFSSFHESALETLTDVMIQYIQNIGKTAQFYANMAGRVEGNALDIVQALEDLGSGLGFDGAPDVEHCLADSGVVKDIIRYTGEAEEIPFVYSLPPFPFSKAKRPAPSFSEIGAEPPDEHIPVWLPAFPETSGSNALVETTVEKINGDAQSKENGLPLASMQQSIDVDRLKVQKSMDQKEVEKRRDEPEGNPFLASPVWVGVKNMPCAICPSELTNEEVSINHVPEKHMSHRIPAIEAYAPADKVNGKNRLVETEDGDRGKGGRTQRALLRFKIENQKASVCKTRKQSLVWFKEDEDKKEKEVEGEENHKKSIDRDVK